MTDPRTAVMARAALFPVELLRQFLNDPRSEPERLAELAAHPVFLEALTIASPTLAAELSGVTPDLPEKRLRSLTLGVTRYLLRATTRCTPFGLFAGVRHLPLGEETRLELAHPAGHRKTLRVDAQQVWELVKQWEDHDDLRDDLHVYANPTVYQVGERLRLPYQDTYGQGRHSSQASLRATPIVRRILHLAERPLPLRALLDTLRAEHPDAPREHIRAFTLKLMEQQLLLSTLRPPMTAPDPLAYLHAQAPRHPAGAPLQERLGSLLDLTRAYNATRAGEGLPTLRRLLQVLKFESGQTQRQVQVDTRLEARGSFAERDRQDLEDAVHALAGLLPGRETPLRGFVSEFLERYGNREVPLLELLDPQYGLGAPATYLNPPSARKHPPRPQPQLLFQVLQHAAGTGELDLKTASLPGNPNARRPESVDVFVRRVEQGDRTWLVMEGLHGPGGNTFGRFTHLDEELHEHWRARAALEEQDPDLIVADLVYAESTGHANNVAIHAPIYRHESAVACTPGVPHERHIPLGDVMVGVHAGQFYLRSRSRGLQLRFRTPHVLNPALAPNAVRFLQEVSQMSAPDVPFWSWEDAADLEFLPRVTHGRVVISPKRWRLRPGTLQAEDFAGALAAERADRGIPRFVYAGSGDNRLLLDLEQPLCQELLRSVAGRESDAVTEALGGYETLDGRSPLGHHAVQYVVTFPLAPARVPPLTPRVDERPDERLRWVLPFQGGVYLKLYGPPDMQDDVVSTLRGLLRLAGEEHGPLHPEPDAWFFVRYADPGHHLRWRVFGEGPAFEATVRQLLREAAALQQRGLLTRVELCSYEREIERYGGNRGVLLSERLFAADSAWLAHQLGLGLPGGDGRIPHIAATLDALLDALHLGAAERRWVLENACAGYREEFGPAALDPDRLERLLKEDLRRSRTTLWRELARLYPLPGEPTCPHLEAFRARVAPLAPALRELSDPGTDPERAALLLTSLTHMHANRAGLDRFQEFRALHLLLKTHQGFAHHLPETIDPRAFHPTWSVRTSPRRTEVHA